MLSTQSFINWHLLVVLGGLFRACLAGTVAPSLFTCLRVTSLSFLSLGRLTTHLSASHCAADFFSIWRLKPRGIRLSRNRRYNSSIITQLKLFAINPLRSTMMMLKWLSFLVAFGKYGFIIILYIISFTSFKYLQVAWPIPKLVSHVPRIKAHVLTCV